MAWEHSCLWDHTSKHQQDNYYWSSSNKLILFFNKTGNIQWALCLDLVHRVNTKINTKIRRITLGASIKFYRTQSHSLFTTNTAKKLWNFAHFLLLIHFNIDKSFALVSTTLPICSMTQCVILNLLSFDEVYIHVWCTCNVHQYIWSFWGKTRQQKCFAFFILI